MTPRRWLWVIVLSALAAVDLSAAISAHIRWHAPAGSQAVLTLPQLLGFASSGFLIVVVALILISSWRSWRQRRRLAAWRSGLRSSEGTCYIDLGEPE